MNLVIKDCKIALICQSRYIIPILGLPIMKSFRDMHGTAMRFIARVPIKAFIPNPASGGTKSSKWQTKSGGNVKP